MKHSGKHLERVMRKELLLIRADLERAEVIQARAELDNKFRYFGWLKGLLPQPAAASALGKSPLRWRDYPMLSSALSLLLLVRPSWLGAFRTVKPLAKWTAFGVTVWKGIRLWRRIAPHRR